MKIEIKNVKGEVIFSHKCEENTIRKVVEAAIEQEANLSYANLDNVVFNERTSFFSMQCPEEGSFIGWKVASEKIVKLLITEDSKRSSATSLKCRCSKAKVLAIQETDGTPSNVNEARSSYDDSFIYKIGEVVEVDDFDENRWNECSTGIHFFVSRDMAVRYY